MLDQIVSVGPIIVLFVLMAVCAYAKHLREAPLYVVYTHNEYGMGDIAESMRLVTRYPKHALRFSRSFQTIESREMNVIIYKMLPGKEYEIADNGHYRDHPELNTAACIFAYRASWCTAWGESKAGWREFFADRRLELVSEMVPRPS